MTPSHCSQHRLPERCPQKQMYNKFGRAKRGLMYLSSCCDADEEGDAVEATCNGCNPHRPSSSGCRAWHLANTCWVATPTNHSLLPAWRSSNLSSSATACCAGQKLAVPFLTCTGSESHCKSPRCSSAPSGMHSSTILLSSPSFCSISN